MEEMFNFTRRGPETKPRAEAAGEVD
ncbi:hypothetical protein CCACVL1_26359 [Corchorus capsularis]|uniref:Uncharacterized protein n=1 Tax=Corchorus capsularis TaxID=210143 RepID=A0A1R3GF32_COCAP|nr:hypothetical protein CCACVL1_26359 [Corchorus capsularis]